MPALSRLPVVDLPTPAPRGARCGPVVESPAAPAAGPVTRLVDRYGRTARDLRLSVTDRCNLRCTYCMSAQGMDWLATPELLTVAEIARLARLAVERLGVERIRLTGGEPLLRRNLEEVVAAVAGLRTRSGGAVDVGLTTNGLGLDKRAASLRAAGLGRVNVSLDSLEPAEYTAITRRDRLEDVLRGIVAAQEAGLTPVKINAVAVAGALEERAPRLLAESLRRGWQLRFIEHMPLGPHETWRPQEVVGRDEVLRVLAEAGFRLTEIGRANRRPATLWRVSAGRGAHGSHPEGVVGVISSVTVPFCSDCDRTRVTADGRLMTCLFSSQETDLRGPMRSGASDEEIIELWAAATWGKPLAHGSDEPWDAPDGFERPARTMSAIGG
ncbi:GTP 3',8-cyclase MoaA [Actinomyces trachealis]|uniref:GTP 3',8-cyclase MoaA n=1 Tax=Actinomyces trachealis TaxID=2763540 RepID=UPI001892C126|nr:GTP 3',8-cyclase MoaA [Actinomyces trachealis]